MNLPHLVLDKTGEFLFMRRDGSQKIINISAGKVLMSAQLNGTGTAAKVWDILPVSAAANLWGNEIYFEIPLQTGPEKPQEVVSLGDIAYWPPGKALCLFFGPTPVSRGQEIRPYSAVNVVGHLTGDPALLRQVTDGEMVTVSRKE